MELLVATVVMGIVMVMATTSIFAVYASSHQSEAVANTSQDVNRAFMLIDRHIRYADTMTQNPGHSAVTFHLPASAGPMAGTYRLRVAHDTLQWQRSTGSAWGEPRVIMSGLVDPGSGAVTPALQLANPATLEVTLGVAGDRDNTVVSQLHATFRALNIDDTAPPSGREAS